MMFIKIFKSYSSILEIRKKTALKISKECWPSSTGKKKLTILKIYLDVLKKSLFPSIKKPEG